LIFTLTEALYSQEISGVVVDDNNAPIPYVNITVRSKEYNNYGWTTNEEGKFMISPDFLKKNDSIIFSSIGFEKKRIAFKELGINQKNLISLQSISYKLNEIAIMGSKLKKTIKEVGNHKNKTEGGDFFPLHCVLTIFVENEYQEIGYLKSIKIKLRKQGLGLKTRLWKQESANSPITMRMHVYGVTDPTEGPQKELLEESVVATLNTNKKWITVDMEKYHIEFPKNGLFVGFRYLPANNGTVSDLIKGCQMNAFPTFRIQRGFVRKNEKCNTWVRFFKEVGTSHGTVFKPGQWYFLGDEGNFHPRAGKTNAVMSTEIIFYE
jgi:hypothetical protein